jgi:hypothetical protein
MNIYLNLKPHCKKQLFLFFFILFSFIATAQNKKTKFFAETSIGPSFPIGKFSNKKYTGSFLSNADGLAKTGVVINLSFGYQLKKTFGTMLLFGYSQNKQDANSFDRYLKNNFGDNTSTSVETNKWQVFKILGGGYLVVPFSAANKLSFRAKLLGGICKTNIPGFKYAYSVPGNPIPTVGSGTFAKINLPWSFCYQLTTGLNYQIAQKIYLLFDAGYFGSNPIYKYSYNPNFPPRDLHCRQKRILLCLLWK